MILDLDIMERVASWLELANIRFERRGQVIVTRWKTKYFEDLTIKILKSDEGVWLYLVTWLPYRGKLTRELMRKLLSLNWKRNGTKIGLDYEGDITIFAEILTSVANMDVLTRYIQYLVETCDDVWELFRSKRKDSNEG